MAKKKEWAVRIKANGVTCFGTGYKTREHLKDAVDCSAGIAEACSNGMRFECLIENFYDTVMRFPDVQSVTFNFPERD